MPEADEFTRFEHEGWQRVARKHENAWSSLTRGFMPYLLKERIEQSVERFAKSKDFAVRFAAHVIAVNKQV